MEANDWYYVVRCERHDHPDNNPSFFRHKDRLEALARAKGFIKVSIDKYCNDYRMGKVHSSLHNIRFTLSFGESIGDDISFSEEII